MIMKGQKRKFPPEEDAEVSDRSSPTWESQRQFVFSVSLSKYQRGQELPEPSLRRSVLIANTLRQINLEACAAPPPPPPPVDQEAPPPPCPSEQPEESQFPLVPSAKQEEEVSDGGRSALAPFPESSSPYSSNCGASRCPTICLSNPSGAPPSGEDDEDWGSMSTDADFSLSAAISSILSALDSTMGDGGPQAAAAAARTPLRSLENLSRSSEWLRQGVRGHGWEPAEDMETATRSGHLGELSMDDLFQDIDTSLLERDMGVLGLRGGGPGCPAAAAAGDDLLRYLPQFSPNASSSSPHLQTFSLSLNQNLKCLPSFSSFSPLSSSLPSPPPSLFSAQGRDGLELDHLMEILVES